MLSGSVVRSFSFGKRTPGQPPEPFYGAYLALPGNNSGSIAYTGNMSLPGVTDSLSVAIRLLPTDGWTGYYGTLSTLISKWNLSNGTFMFNLSSGRMNFRSSTNGAIVNNINSLSLIYASSPPSGKIPYWLGVICSHVGSGDVSFYTSIDGTSWSKLGNSSTLTYTGAIYNPANSPLRIGSYISPTGGNEFNGKIYRIKIFSGPDASFSSTPIVDFNPSLYTGGSSFTSATGETWTLSGSTSIVTS